MSDPKYVKLELNKSGVKELLKSQDMMNICTEIACKAQARLGDGYEVSYRTGKNRAIASVAAVTPEAQKENGKNNTILKALRG